MRRALIVCDGNTCRSPTLGILLRRLAFMLGRGDDFITAGCSDSAKQSDPMPLPGRLVLSEVIAWLDHQSALPKAHGHEKQLETLLSDAASHPSRSLNDKDLKGPFDDFLVIVPPKRKHAPFERLDQFRSCLKRLAVPPRSKWKVIIQADSGYYAWVTSKAQDPDHDLKVLETYLKQGKALGEHALRYYNIILDTARH